MSTTDTLYFSIGNEENRGELLNTTNKIINGQISVGISNQRNDIREKGKKIDDDENDKWYFTKEQGITSRKDARLYLDKDNERIPINSYFSDYSHFSSCIEIKQNGELKKMYLLGSTETDTTPLYDTDVYFIKDKKGAIAAKQLLLSTSLNIGSEGFIDGKAFYVKGDTKLEGTTDFASGHLYLTGSVSNSSTSNTTQIVFGTSTDPHIAISSNTKALVLNPTTSSTSNQIVLYLDQQSKFPSGIEAGNLTVTGNTVLGNLNVDTDGVSADTVTIKAVTTFDGMVYFANGDTYFINNSGSGKLNALEVENLVINGNTVLGDTPNVDSFNINAKTTFNGMVYFANGSTYYIDNDGSGNLNSLILNATTTSTSSATGALTVSGGVGIGENIYVGGSLNVTGNTTLNGAISILNTTTSTSSSTGALTVSGGVGIGENVYIGGLLNVAGNTTLGSDNADTITINGITSIASNTTSTSSATGALTVSGGVGIAGNAYVGGALNITGASTLKGAVSITNTTVSSSYTTGALIVSGGVGIAGNTYVNGLLSVNGNATLGNATSDIITLQGKIIVSSAAYGSSPPTSGNSTGQIYFKLV